MDGPYTVAATRMNLWMRKTLDQLLAAPRADGEHALKKTLGPGSLIALGIGAIIGAGLFVRTASAAAYHAGPAVTIAFIVAAVGCAFAGLCYAEFASMIPIAGSAYTYSYATLGELMAWIIGWDLVLEYAVGAATVGIAWSEYFNRLVGFFGYEIDYAWCHSPVETLKASAGTVIAHGIVNIPAIFIILALTLLLIRGTKESAFVNALIVITKVTIVVLLIALGWGFIDPANHTLFVPEASTITDKQGVEHAYGSISDGILGAAGVVFFAFIGFDAVSTAAQESVNPKRDMPIGILGSLAGGLHRALRAVLVRAHRHRLGRRVPRPRQRGLGRVGDQRAHARLRLARRPGHRRDPVRVHVGDPGDADGPVARVLHDVARRLCCRSQFSDVHPKYRTPYRTNLVFFGFVGMFAGFLPEDLVGDMTSIGTLFAFVCWCRSVQWVLRVRDPNAPRPFRTPAELLLVPILGVVVNMASDLRPGLVSATWTRLGVWLAVGLVIYFGYGRHHSKLQQADR